MNDWRQRARCRDTDPETFFPVGTVGQFAEDQINAAKAVCQPCPVRIDCLAWALDTHQNYGIWGGMAAEERRQLARKRVTA